MEARYTEEFDWKDQGMVLRFRDPEFKDSFPVLDKMRREMHDMVPSFAKRVMGDLPNGDVLQTQPAMQVFTAISPAVMSDLVKLTWEHTEYAYQETMQFEPARVAVIIENPVEMYRLVGKFAAWCFWGDDQEVLFTMVADLVEWQRVYA